MRFVTIDSSKANLLLDLPGGVAAPSAQVSTVLLLKQLSASDKAVVTGASALEGGLGDLPGTSAAISAALGSTEELPTGFTKLVPPAATTAATAPPPPPPPPPPSPKRPVPVIVHPRRMYRPGPTCAPSAPHDQRHHGPALSHARIIIHQPLMASEITGQPSHTHASSLRDAPT